MNSNLLKRKCQEHNNKQVVFACQNQFCKEKRIVCQSCLDKHCGHNKDLIEDAQIEELLYNSQLQCKQFIKKMNEKFNELTILFRKLISLVESKFYISIERINGVDNQQFSQYLTQLIIQDQQQSNLSQMFTDGYKYFENQIIQCQNELNLNELNQIKITKEEMEKVKGLYKQSYYYYLSGDYVNAIKGYDLVLEFDQNHLDSLIDKAKSLFMLGKFNESIECYDKALKILPDSDCLHQQKGECLKMLQQYKQAIECFDSALQIDNNNEQALVQKGECLIELNELDKAEIYIKRLIEIDRNSQNYKNLLSIFTNDIQEKIQDKRKR